MEEQIKKLYADIWQSMTALYLTLITQKEGTDDYLISETLIWRDRSILNKTRGMFPDIINELPFAKELTWDCICHTREEHMTEMEEIGLKNVREIYGNK